MRTMSEAEVRDFLAGGARIANLATVRADGHPHVVPLWFVLDGDDLVMTTSYGSAKARHLRREPRVSISVNDDEQPYAFVSCLGTATLQHRPPDLVTWTTRVATRYVGAERGVELGRRYAEIDDLVVRVRPHSLIGHAEILD